MRRITVARFASYLLGLLFLAALSAGPSHADCAAGGIFQTPELVFGRQSVGASGLTQTATLTFFTGCPVTISHISISMGGTNAGDFSAAGNGATPCSPTATFAVSSGAPASCTIGATFAPTANGTRTATITVSYTVTGAFSDSPSTLNIVGGDEIVYVTTGDGGQVLTVDGTTGAAEVLSNGPSCGTPPCFKPTGAVVGPDGKIYVTDQVNSNIWRMNQDGSQLEQVYNQGNCSIQLESPCAQFPEGPSFGGSGTGDLYFNTFVQAGPGTGALKITGAATTPFGGGFNLPVSVEPCNATDTNCPFTGSGTGFDANGNFLTADQEDSEIWSLAPPYLPSTPPTVILSNASSQVRINAPTGIALNKANGQIYVANSDSSQQILQIAPGSPYTTTAYYTFTTTSAACNDATDFPDYFGFDMMGHAFVVTSVSPAPGGANNCGKVWRIDPGASPTATLLVDLGSAFGSGIPNVCFAPCGLNGGQGVGLAMPPTAGAPQTVALTSTGGTATVGWPAGCTPTNTPPNNCSSTIGIQYPANMFSNSDTLDVTFTETSQQQFVANAGASPYAVTTLAPVEGYNGDGIVPTLLCTNGGNPCNDSVTVGTSYNVFTTWQSNQTTYCSQVPHVLRGDPPGGPYTSLFDTIISCTDGGVGTKAQSSCSSTSSSSCLSDWDNTFGPISGPTASATITTPSNGAQFSANETETATFSCAQNPSSPSVVVSCPALVTQPDGSIVPVVSGGNLPTAQAGNYTLSVAPNVDGSSGITDALVTYKVSNTFQFIGFSAPITNSPVLNVATAGQAIPVAFQVLDAGGNPLTNLTMPPVSIIFQPSSCSNFPTSGQSDLPDVNAAGNSGFQNLGGGNYQFNWKTSKGMKGACGQLQVDVGDGVVHRADFQFK